MSLLQPEFLFRRKLNPVPPSDLPRGQSWTNNINHNKENTIIKLYLVGVSFSKEVNLAWFLDCSHELVCHWLIHIFGHPVSWRNLRWGIGILCSLLLLPLGKPEQELWWAACFWFLCKQKATMLISNFVLFSLRKYRLRSKDVLETT